MSLSSSFRFSIDLHVHTRRFSACAEGLDPERLPDMIHRNRLDGLVITEHDHQWPPQDIDRLNRRLSYGRIYNGVEVSSRNGHFVVIGLETMDGIAQGMDLPSLVRCAHAQQAAVIWAHPFQAYGNTPEPSDLQHLPVGIDALEIISSLTTGSQATEAQYLAGKMEWAEVAGSDAHTLARVGCAVTLFESLPDNEKLLAQAIRDHHCRVMQHDDTAAMRCIS